MSAHNGKMNAFTHLNRQNNSMHYLQTGMCHFKYIEQ